MSYYFFRLCLRNYLQPAAALAASTPAAFAGPYLNWETNLSYTGSDYTSALHELHIGWEGENGAASYYIQGGPAYSAVDAASSSDLEFSGKAGGADSPSPNLSAFTVNCPWSLPKRMAMVPKGESSIPSDSHRN